jgi:histidinol phosphatase-like enzyme|tara:strand:+ start:34849 stop:35232 length:384 start_codon:yes stop_codon:yes gene_type:complete
MKEFLKLVDDQERKVVAIDFDGVIHRNSKGFFDGTVYDPPIEGSINAIKEMSKKYDLVIFTCKALEDRPLINEKTGIQLINKWLQDYEIKKYIKEVTFIKPRAFLYIDDKGYRFTGWKEALSFIEEL